MPIPPLDGGHLLLAAIPPGAAQRVRAFYAKICMLGMLPIMAIAMLGGGAIMAAAAAALTHVLIGVSSRSPACSSRARLLPAMAALGMAIGSLKKPAHGPADRRACKDRTRPARPPAARIAPWISS